MNSKIACCFIGAGFHASTNIYPSAIEAGIDIKAIATRRMASAQAAIQTFNSQGRAYDDYHDMLEKEECNGVVIVAQPKDQYKIALDCIRKGKHVYVDKPLGWTAEEAKELYDLAKEKKVKVMVGFMKRYAPSYGMLKTYVKSEELGRPCSFNMDFSVNGTPFCKDQESFIKLAAIHVIDLLRFLFGDVSDVVGFSHNNNEHITNSISLKFQNKVVGNLSLASMTAWSRESETIKVTFEHGFIIVDEINQVTVHRSNEGNNDKPFASLTETDQVFTPSMTPMSGTLRDIYLRGFVGEMKHFAEAITGDLEPSSNAEDNVKTMALCDRLVEILK